MKKFDVDDFCESINSGMPYEEICKKFNIKTKEQFKRYLYEGSIKKGEIIKYDFPLKGSAGTICFLNDGSIKMGKVFVQQILNKMGIINEKANIEVDEIDYDSKKIILKVS